MDLEIYASQRETISIPMKSSIFPLLIVSVTLLSSCGATPVKPQEPPDVVKLQEKIDSLKLENANLKEENNLLRAGGEPSSIQNSTGALGDNGGTTYEEGNYASCMKQTQADYIVAGSKACKDEKYSDAEILANKCQLDRKVLTDLSVSRKNAEASCTSLYQ